MRIVVDAMGSDHYPEPDVAGAVMAAREFGDEIILVGDEARLQTELAKHDTSGLKLQVRHASQVIEMTDTPSKASREKRDSSMHVGLQMVGNGEGDAFVSAGNTGGILAVATLRQYGLGRIPGVKRPALGVIFPTKERPLLMDNGANADCKPEYLLQFGMMGSLYLERALGIKNPRVALISNGEEEGKGNQLIKETIPLLANSGLNYVGNIEPKEFMRGEADIALADGFTGNIMMKTAEAVASYLLDLVRQEIKAGTITTLGGLLARPAFRRAGKQLDPNEVGGAPLLGVNGVVVIAHGRSNAYAMKQAIYQARQVVKHKVVEAIREGIGSAESSEQ